MKKEFVIICLMLLAGCSKERTQNVGGSSLHEDEETVSCELSFGTRSGDSGNYTDTTFRAQLFYRGTDINHFTRFDSLMTPYTGTYCKPKGSNTWLTPCSVDADYNYGGTEGSQYGLRAGRYHDYYLFLSTPATPYFHYADTVMTNPLSGKGETMEYWGLKYLRGGAAKDHPAISTNAKVTTKGLTLQDYYKYSLDDTMKLVEYRSRIAFSVRCGDAIDHANIKMLEINGLRKEAVFRPFTKDFFFNNVPENIEDVVVYESTSATGLRLERTEVTPGVYVPGISQNLTGQHTSTHLDDPQTNTHFTYILSDDYKSLDAGNKYIHQPAEMLLTLCSDDGVPIELDPLPLAFIFEPQKSYFYLITINSVRMVITVYTKDWNAPIVNDTSIDEPESWTITINIKDWTQYINAGQVDAGPGGGGDTPANTTINGLTTDNWNDAAGGSGAIDVIQMVDLALPSGVKWGSCNLGNTWPEEDGLHVGFGGDTCNTWMGTKWSVLGFPRVPECEVDASGNLLPRYDVAHTWLPSPWRMPTKAEFEELLDTDNCTQSWTSDYNGTGVAGMVFTSVRNAKSIFLPACGYGANAVRTDAGTGGYYWSSTKSTDTDAWALTFTSGAAGVTATARNYGLNIRPVAP